MASIRTCDMRAAVESVYNGRKWKVKVANMSDRQVVALYYKFVNEGKIDDDPRPARIDIHHSRSEKRQEFDPYIGEQLKFEGLS